MYDIFQKQRDVYIDEQKRAGVIAGATVYFQDLNFGPTFGINDTVDFAPASLLKLPIVLAYMNLEESRPGTLEQLVVYNGHFNDAGQTYVPIVHLEVGKRYAIKELLFNTLAYSDNASLDLLIGYLAQVPSSDTSLYQTFQDLGTINPLSPEDQTIDVHTLGGLFRILHNASYLSPESSEKIITWLSQSTFTDGLVAGVPAGVDVAQKFGERQEGSDVSISTQFHDCGIVYYPSNPYTLCIMTSGRDTKELVKVIAEISRRVYEEVDSRHL